MKLLHSCWSLLLCLSLCLSLLLSLSAAHTAAGAGTGIDDAARSDRCGGQPRDGDDSDRWNAAAASSGGKQTSNPHEELAGHIKSLPKTIGPPLISSTFSLWRMLVTRSGSSADSYLPAATVSTINKLEVAANRLFNLASNTTSRTSDMILTPLSKALLSSSSAEAVNDIIHTLATSNSTRQVRELFQEHDHSTILQSTRCLSALQRLYPRQSAKVVEQGSPSPPPGIQSDIAHYSVYSNAAYGWKGSLFFRRHIHRSDVSAICGATGLSRGDVICARLRSKTNKPGYFLSRDRRRKTIGKCRRPFFFFPFSN